MEGKILGIPLVLIFFVLGVALLVDLPMVGLHIVTQQRLDKLTAQTTVWQRSVLQSTASPEATLTPSPTPSPTSSPARGVVKPPVFIPSSTPSGVPVQ